jgi:hypothetical protein
MVGRDDQRRRWTVQPALHIDAGAAAERHDARFKWPVLLHDQRKCEIDYFYLLFPTEVMPEVVIATNENLVDGRHAKTSTGELYRWFGTRLAMAVQQRRGTVAEYWRKEPREGFVSQASDFGSLTKMTRHRFETLSTCISFGDETNVLEDPWQPVRPLITAFNSNRRTKVLPGNMLVVDECMSAWRGRSGKYCVEGMPHVTKIPRKPEGIGAEIKAMACGATGILLRLEIMEGQRRQADKPHAKEYGEGTAVVLRLTEDFKGTGRTVVGDSAFSSVRTLVALGRRGLHFMGCVKTAHSGYPKKVLEAWASGGPTAIKPARGSHCLLSSQYDNTSFYALGWLDKKLLTYISSRGTTHAGSKSIRFRHRRTEVAPGEFSTQRVVLAIDRPHMVELFYKCFSKIDVHDHLRQGSLAIEKEWLTHKWWHRILATIFGMCVVDAYLAYSYEMKMVCDVPVEFLEFVDKLSYQLINNIFLAPSARRSSPAPEPPKVDAKHLLRTLRSLPGKAQLAGRGQRRCHFCKSPCSYYCMGCSDLTLDTVVPVCGAGVRDCYMEHLLDIFSRSI